MDFKYRTVFASLFLKPRKAFATIYYYDLFKFQYYLFALAGVNNVVTRKWLEIADVSNNFIMKLVIEFAIGALFGWLPILFISWLLYLSAKWLKGKCDFISVYNIIVYATCLPAFISLLSTVLSITLLRSNGYMKGVFVNNLHIIIIRTHLYLNWGINLYYAFLVVIGISVIQQFTIIKSIFNIFLAVMIVVIPLVIIVLIPSLYHH
jgi:hypothetical protein